LPHIGIHRRRSVVLTSLKPTELIAHFNAPELEATAGGVEEALTKIIREGGHLIRIER
jgi:hypothetical protein